MDRFNARTNGAYKMEIFPGGQLGPFPESLDAIRTGAIEAGMIPLAAFGGSVPEFGLVELPFLFNNGEANAYAMPSVQAVWDELSQAEANQRTLGCMFVGTANFLSTKPLKTLDDMKGTIVGVDAPPSVGLIEALGGSGIVVDFTEDYSSLQKGVIDAKTSAPQYIQIAKLYEVAKNYTVFHGIGSLYAFTINSDVYNAMPKEIQDALAEELSATAESISDKYVTKFYELEPVLKDLGLEYYYLPPAERDNWKALAYPATLDALANAGDVGTKIKQIADEANAKYPYVQEQ
jgi:TRAP-type C4-dicarboxylate transport system substrate-binding protein